MTFGSSVLCSCLAAMSGQGIRENAIRSVMEFSYYYVRLLLDVLCKLFLIGSKLEFKKKHYLPLMNRIFLLNDNLPC